MSEIVQVVGVSPSGGISQQPAAQRLPGQVEDATNVVFDAGYGFYKRPGTDFDRAFTATAGADVRHDIWTYGDEKYIVVWGKINAGAMTVRVFRIGGNECAVTFDSGTATYLAASSATGSDILLRPVGDNMLLVNTKVATALTTTSAFTIERTRPTYRDLIAYTSTTSNYLRTENDDATADAGYYQYEPGTYKYAHINFPTITNPWSISYGYWDDTGYGNNAGFKIAFRRQGLTGFTGATWTAATRTLTKAGAFTNYTFRSGDMIYITGGTGHTAGWYQIASRTSADAIVLSVDAGLSGADNADTEANATDATSGISETNICRIGRQVNIEIDFTNQNNAANSMHDIAATITQAIRNAGCENACCAWVPQAQGGNFQITGPYRGNDARVYLPTAPASGTIAANGDLTSSGRPFYSTNAQIYAGSGGTPTEDTATAESRWTRVAAPGQSSGKPSPTTMPIKITRSSANNFSVDVGPWTSRTAGNSTTNPGAKLMTTGTKIRDAVWHEGRTFLVGGGYIDSSTAKDAWDLFIQDPTQVVDSDPINKTLPGRYRGDIHYALPWNDVLVLFHDSGQFELSSGANPLAPGTAIISPSTSYPTTRLRPRAGASQLFFASADFDNMRVLEYAYNDIRAASDAAIVTAHVPELMDTNQRRMALVPLTQSLLIIPSTGQTCYVYRWHYDANEKVQSAWTTFDFDEGYRFVGVSASRTSFWLLVENTSLHTLSTGDVSLTITAHGLSDGNAITLSESTTTPNIDGTKYVDVIDANTVEVYDDALLTTPTTLTAGGTVRRNTGDYTIERLSVSDTRAASGWAYAPNMDRQLTLTGVYSGGKTTWTLPNTPTVVSGSAQLNGYGSTLNKIVLGPDFGANSGDVVSITEYTTTSVKVTGDYSAGEVILGRYFDWEVELGKPFPKTGRGRPNIQSRPAILGLSVRHQNATDYTVEMVQENAPTRTRAFSSDDAESGTFRTLLSGFVDASEYTIKNTSASDAVKPASIVAVQFEMERATFSDQQQQ